MGVGVFEGLGSVGVVWFVICWYIWLALVWFGFIFARMRVASL